MVCKIKNMLTFLRLEIVNHGCSLHSDVYSYLHASLLNHKKKTIVRKKIKSKDIYSPCAAPPSLVNQESRLCDDRGFFPIHRQDSEIAGRAKPRPNWLGRVNMPIDTQYSPSQILASLPACSRV